MKRVFSLLMALMLAIGMAAAAYAANPKITTQIAEIPGTDVGERGPGYKIWLPLTKDAFEGATDDLTLQDTKTSKITIKQTAKSGSKAIESVEIKENSSKVACISITLKENFESTKALDFEIKLQLYINNKRQDFDTVVTGTLTNEEEIVFADTDYIDLSDGRIAKCEESARKVEAYLGNDVTVFVNMSKGKEYYGKVTTEPDEDDDAVFSEYPEVEAVIALTTIGLNAAGQNVRLDNQDENYFVYNKNLEYLGRSDEMLPYSTKYYLATKMLDVDEITDDIEEPQDLAVGDDDVPEPFEGDEDSEESGSNQESSEQSQQLNNASPADGGAKTNPDTGTSPIFYIALAAGVTSLSVLVATGPRTKK